MRLPAALVPGLAVALAVVAGLADRALVGQADAARAAAVARIDEEARLAALSVRASLAQLEQAVAAGRPAPGVDSERLAVPPPRSVPPPGLVPYGGRSRAELAELLSSTRATPNGLPEAVVARLALGPAAPVSGAAGSPAVEERLLAGELPVRPEDLPFLASRLGVASDPRVPALEARLRRAPDAAELPAAPGFRRRLVRAGSDRGLDPRGRPVAAALRAAGRGAPRARGRLGARGGLAGRRARSTRSAPSLSRTVPVPDVEGLFLRVAPRAAGRSSPGRPAGRALAVGRGGRRRPPGPASRPRPGGAGGRPRARLPGRRHPRAAHAAHHDPGAGRDARGRPGRAARVRHARGPGERAARGARGARPDPDPRRAGPAVRPRRSRRAAALGGGARRRRARSDEPRGSSAAWSPLSRSAAGTARRCAGPSSTCSTTPSTHGREGGRVEASAASERRRGDGSRSRTTGPGSGARTGGASSAASSGAAPRRPGPGSGSTSSRRWRAPTGAGSTSSPRRAAARPSRSCCRRGRRARKGRRRR